MCSVVAGALVSMREARVRTLMQGKAGALAGAFSLFRVFPQHINTHATKGTAVGSWSTRMNEMQSRLLPSHTTSMHTLDHAPCRRALVL